MGGRGCQADTPGEGVSLPNRYLLFGHQIYPSKNAAECQAPLPNRYKKVFGVGSEAAARCLPLLPISSGLPAPIFDHGPGPQSP